MNRRLVRWKDYVCKCFEWDNKVEQGIIGKGDLSPRESKVDALGGSVSVNVPVVAAVNTKV